MGILASAFVRSSRLMSRKLSDVPDVVEGHMSNNETSVFHSPSDARKFLGQIARVWVVWLALLAILAFAVSPWNWAIGGVLLVALMFLIVPIQQRVDRDVPQDGFDENRASLFLGRGTRRDRALRAMLGGAGP
ncbi:MAG TPA: hypothetical protein ENG98_03810, partial [Actinobacteria bacterium]|nr:hypothetical protein [Actinomycetota bacterium]